MGRGRPKSWGPSSNPGSRAARAASARRLPGWGARFGPALAPVAVLCPASRESGSCCGDAAGRRCYAEGGVCERALVCVWVCVCVCRCSAGRRLPPEHKSEQGCASRGFRAGS